MRSAVVLMTGFALLVAGILVLALGGPAVLGIALLVVGLLTKIGGVLLGDAAAGPATSRAPDPRAGRARAGSGAARGVTVHARRVPAPSTMSDQHRRRAS